MIYFSMKEVQIYQKLVCNYVKKDCLFVKKDDDILMIAGRTMGPKTL